MRAIRPLRTELLAVAPARSARGHSRASRLSREFGVRELSDGSFVLSQPFEMVIWAAEKACTLRHVLTLTLCRHGSAREGVPQ
jgi:hypothetical protein